MLEAVTIIGGPLGQDDAPECMGCGEQLTPDERAEGMLLCGICQDDEAAP